MVTTVHRCAADALTWISYAIRGTHPRCFNRKGSQMVGTTAASASSSFLSVASMDGWVSRKFQNSDDFFVTIEGQQMCRRSFQHYPQPKNRWPSYLKEKLILIKK